MIWQVSYTEELPSPSWPCRLVGSPFLAPVVSETVSPGLLAIPSPVAIELVSQFQPATHLFYVVHQGFHCLLWAPPVVVVIPRCGAYLPYAVPVAIVVV